MKARSSASTAMSWALAGLLGVAGLALLHLWTPSDDIRYSLCLSRRLGLPCPGCGMTRALAHLAKGEWRAALTAHPFSPVLAAELALGWLLWGVQVVPVANIANIADAADAGRLSRRIWPAGLTPMVLVLANLALLVALWAGRLAAGTLPR
jgi:hypothetical protein